MVTALLLTQMSCLQQEMDAESAPNKDTTRPAAVKPPTREKREKRGKRDVGQIPAGLEGKTPTRTTITCASAAKDTRSDNEKYNEWKLTLTPFRRGERSVPVSALATTDEGIPWPTVFRIDGKCIELADGAIVAASYGTCRVHFTPQGVEVTGGGVYGRPKTEAVLVVDVVDDPKSVPSITVDAVVPLGFIEESDSIGRQGPTQMVPTKLTARLIHGVDGEGRRSGSSYSLLLRFETPFRLDPPYRTKPQAGISYGFARRDSLWGTPRSFCERAGDLWTCGLGYTVAHYSSKAGGFVPFTVKEGPSQIAELLEGVVPFWLLTQPAPVPMTSPSEAKKLAAFLRANLDVFVEEPGATTTKRP